MELRAFLFENVYLSPSAKIEEPKAFGVVERLFMHYLENPQDLPDEFAPASDAELVQRVTDYIAGMTDRYATRVYESLFVPASWRM